jgi:hypothetical protein
MYPIFVRPAKKDDQKRYVQWAISTENTGLDPTVLTYPSTSIKVAFNKDGPIIFLPIHRPIHLESLAVRPGATDGEKAAALRALLQDVITVAMQEGVGEIWYQASEETLPEFAKKAGFKEVPYKIYRLKIADLEKHD